MNLEAKTMCARSTYVYIIRPHATRDYILSCTLDAELIPSDESNDNF